MSIQYHGKKGKHWGFACAAAAGIITACAGSAGAVAAKPNIIIIMADDMGSADVSFQPQHQPDVVTPNIDTIRSRGVAFSTAYITGNICAPSRLGLMSGQYQNRFGLINGNIISSIAMPATVQTIARRLKDAAGYKTIMLGKWHLGEDASSNGPVDRGFDEAWYFNSNGKSPYFFTSANYPGLDGSAIYHNRDSVPPNGSYLTDFWTTNAINFITANASTNFFMYLAYNAVHADLHWPYNEADTSHSNREMVTEMGKYMDNCIGTVMAKLDELGIRNNTLIFFLSDNGGVCKGYTDSAMTSDNRPLREGKHYDYEGGIRTPFVVSWPAGGIPTNATITSPAISLDIAPTALAAAGVTNASYLANLDGVNLLPILKGQTNSLPGRSLFWSGGSEKADNTFSDGDEAWSAVRNKYGYKLLVHRCDMYLYNLNNDISEVLDISSNKAVVVDLYRELIGWQMQMPPVVDATGADSTTSKKPFYKDTWSYYFPFVDSASLDPKVFNVLEATNIVVNKGGQYQAHVVARYSTGNTVYVHPDQPAVTTWSLISTVGGSVNQQGLFTAGTNDGFVILQAAATFNRRETSDSQDFKSYQLIQVGAGSVYVPPTNHPPVWTSSVINKAAATTGVFYDQSFSSGASDPDGDALIFSKVSGPSWLTVTAVGRAQGTPGLADVGSNSWTVSATDAGGLSTNATLNINVQAGTGPIINSFTAANLLGVTNVNLDTATSWRFWPTDAAKGTAVGSLSLIGTFTTSNAMLSSRSVTNTPAFFGTGLVSNNTSVLAQQSIDTNIIAGLMPTLDVNEGWQFTVSFASAGTYDLRTYVTGRRIAGVKVEASVTVSSATSTTNMTTTLLSGGANTGPMGEFDVVAALNFTVNNAGTVTVKVTDNETARNNGSGPDVLGIRAASLTGSGSAPTPYGTWSDSHGLTGGNADQAADPDGDGANNLYEYALGGNPTNGTDAAAMQPVARLTAGSGSNWLEYVYNRRNDAAARGLIYALERRDDLNVGSWSNIGTSAETGYGPKDAEFDSVTNLIPTAGKTKDFIRLKIMGN